MSNEIYSDRELRELVNLLRHHVEIRNRSFMRNVYRDCFIGSDAVDFLLSQGFAKDRKEGVSIGKLMLKKSLIRHVSGTSSRFQDAYLYYRFQEDDLETSCLSPSSAGHGNHGIKLGHGGCKFSFCSHTANNSYVMDIALAEEIERAVAGASIEARAVAFSKLRSRVKEQASPDAPGWNLAQSSEINKVKISIYQRKRPRGDFKNVKMTGTAPESAKNFIRGIMSFDKRKRWENMFEDGVIVEEIDIGEDAPAIFQDDERSTPKRILSRNNSFRGTNVTPSSSPSPILTLSNMERLSRSSGQDAGASPELDAVQTFLNTVDLAGVPANTPIGCLNDPERQHTLAHLREQMLLFNPKDCMVCKTVFESAAHMRFCPCCAKVTCGMCVSKRIFEVISRKVVNVCIQCYRNSSRIRHPPQALQDTSNINESIIGKWWRPEDLGIVDYSESVYTSDLSDSDSVDISGRSKPIVSGINLEDLSLDEATDTANTKKIASSSEESRNLLKTDSNYSVTDADEADIQIGNAQSDGIGLGVNEKEFMTEYYGERYLSPQSPQVNVNDRKTIEVPISSPSANRQNNNDDKTARCKSCGALILRNIEVIEEHMIECPGLSGIAANTNTGSVTPSGARASPLVFDGTTLSSSNTIRDLPRRPELEKYGTRIIYRTARAKSKVYAPRDVCALQDSFVDDDGTCYVYEISVKHCDVRGMPGYVTADIMLLMHVAKPVKNNRNLCNITIISQVDTRVQGPQWLLSFITEDSAIGNDIGTLRREDLVRELKSSGDLRNILDSSDYNDGLDVSLDDFDLLAVLGRGGFGKVMQVRHRVSGNIYAVKILKKSELRRRKQVERTHTERKILAAVKHPFIVGLHYAFQNTTKLYMVMDFVQGGDFFTLMRKFRKLPEAWVKLYVAEISMALQHLHSMDVVYRDLKPENILMDAEGHLKLTDFGLSRYFETRPQATEDVIADDDNTTMAGGAITRSFCGTEQYMSPEMLLQKGHNYRMDWWCVGLLMHEMMTSKHPFAGPTHYDTLRNMVTKPPMIDTRLSPAAISIIKGFLVKNPINRLCFSGTGINELKQHHFFSDLEWEALYNRKINMPYKPILKDPNDLSSFENTFTDEIPIDSIVDPSDSNKKSPRRGFMRIFGMNGNTRSEEDSSDAFKGFGFTKDDDLEFPDEEDESLTE